jgi:hypothetical protein
VPTHFLCRTHLAHRSRGVRGVHEEESARMRRFCVMARRKTGRTGTEAGRAWGSTLDERGNRKESRRARTGGREAGWAWDSTLDERGNRTESRRARTGGREAGWAWDSTADERRQHESGGGCGKEDRRPEAVGVSQGTQTTKPRKGRLALAPRRARGRRARKREVGGALIGVGREANCSGSR